MEVNVIDVGCAHYNTFKSIEHICDELDFEPRFAVGLDPRCTPDAYFYGHTFVTMLDGAAWTRRGTVDFIENGLGSVTFESGSSDGSRSVWCVDIADLVRGFAPVVLKIDAEGAEVPLLEHLITEGIDSLIHLAWIEWHASTKANRKGITERLSCEVAEWRL